ncbi:MAG: flavin reductase family protein [Oxalobacter sp.]|jgi:flavin reductase (DIM6/NTAB) family NADH-FMN oxidoreductase RutF|nr:MAG: flavin reductase family protein [Oxalobacter sp.]
MKKKNFPLAKVFSLMQSGPTVMVSTALKDKANIMTMSWHMMMEFEPPLIGIVLSEQNFSFELLKKSRQCVINIPTVELMEKVVRCGNLSGRNRDKFKALALTPLPAEKVSAPLIDECYANLECKVVDTRFVNKYNLFVVEVLKAWIAPLKEPAKTLHHLGGGEFLVGGKTVKARSKKK